MLVDGADPQGLLDRYTYLYDLTGNKTGITKERRGMEAESGVYTYGYDALGRLSEIQKDGQMQTRYGYDAFGNRILKEEGTTRTTYRHNALNQLIAENREGIEKLYGYDRRGNLTHIIENGQTTHQYVYGTLNRLEMAVDQAGKAAKYAYNGLGHRVGKQEGSIRKEQLDQLNPQKQIDVEIGNISQIRYTIDLTREYHNLLVREKEQRAQTYFWDGNVTSYEENGRQSYYLQDELGSPLRIEDELGAIKESYGYGAFGEDLYGNQGELQPFGYTGYQMDDIAGTYFAQAREYAPENGRFHGMDVMLGLVESPFTQNRYNYCFNSPVILVDWNGEWPSLSDIGNGIKKGWESVKKVGSEVLETGKKALNSAGKWIADHKTELGVIAGAIGVSALTVLTCGAGGIVTAAVVGASVGASATATVDIVTGQTSSIETYIGSAVGGAIGGILGAPAAIGKIGTTLGLPQIALSVLAKPFMIGGISSGTSTLVGEGLEFLTGTQRRSGREIVIDILESSIVGGGLSFFGSKIKIPGLNSGRNSYQAIFLSGIRKLVNGTGAMHLKTLVKGYVIQFIEALRDAFGTELYDWVKEEILECEKE